MSETITRSEPRKALTSEDLPTLGRPITATRTASSSSGRVGGWSPSAATIASSRSPVPSPWRGRDRHRLAEAEAVELGGRGDRRSGRSTLLAATRTGTSPPRRVFGQLGVAGPQAGAARRRPSGSRRPRRSPAAPGAGRRGPARPRRSRSMPPVSISSKATPFHSQREPLAVAGDPGLGRGDGLACRRPGG